MPLHKNQQITLTIESIASDGNGLGRHEGQVVFVPDTAAGDTAEIQVVKLAKTHAFGRLVSLLQPGAGRQESACPVARQCGGCCFWHLEYEAELQAKHGFVQDALERLAKLEVPVAATLPSPEVQRYRNKVQYPISAGEDGGLALGFYARRSHRLVPCEDCLLQPADLNRLAMQAVRLLEQLELPAYDEASGKGLIRHICLRRSQSTGEVLLCLVINGKKLPGRDYFVQEMQKNHPELAGIVLNQNVGNTNVIFGEHFETIAGSGFVRDTLCGVPQRLSPASFSQVNPQAAALLFGLARQWTGLQKEESLLDLYCGTGVIGLSMAADCRQLVGVEIFPAAAESARRSAEEMGLCNTRFLCADASAAAETLAKEGFRPDVALLDPPRKGCGEAALRPLVEMAPRRVVMISCNPATMARDLQFLAAAGYRVCKAQPVDMFPRTRHVECLALLERE